MRYIVLVKHESKGTLRIPTDVANRENAIAQARMRNEGPGYDWDNATVEDVPHTKTGWTVVQNNGKCAELESGTHGRKTVRCPKKMNPKEFFKWLAPGNMVDEATLRAFFEDK